MDSKENSTGKVKIYSTRTHHTYATNKCQSMVNRMWTHCWLCKCWSIESTKCVVFDNIDGARNIRSFRVWISLIHTKQYWNATIIYIQSGFFIGRVHVIALRQHFFFIFHPFHLSAVLYGTNNFFTPRILRMLYNNKQYH